MLKVVARRADAGTVAKVIPFPRGPRGAARSDLAVGWDVVPAPIEDDPPRPFAIVSLEFRRLDKDGHRRGSMKRALGAALGALTEAGADVEVSGTDEHPVLQARFDGDDGPALAAVSAITAAEEVRRACEGEFVLSGAGAMGSSFRAEGGVRFIAGDPAALTDRLRESAAPGQVLLGGEHWADQRKVEVLPARSAGLGPVPVFVLRGLRS